MSKFLPGEIVNVTIKGARIAGDDGSTVKVTYGHGRYLIPLADDTTEVTIERVAPRDPDDKPAAITLPPLDQDCPHCATPEAQRKMSAARRKWNEEEQAAYEAFKATYEPESDAYDAWIQTDTYLELGDREPDPAGVGCVECDYTKRVLTDAGRQVLDFVRRWTK